LWIQQTAGGKYLEKENLLLFEHIQSFFLVISPYAIQNNNYLYTVYIVLGIINNLEIIQEDAGRFYANTVLFYLRDLNIYRF
jgi:hypothetical protein